MTMPLCPTDFLAKGMDGFDDEADKVFAWLIPLPAIWNADLETINQNTQQVAQTVPIVQAASSSALAAANFKGEWSSLAGALNTPATVLHQERIWLLTEDLADVSLSEPSFENSQWQRLSGFASSSTIAKTLAYGVI
ncbi:hypothetical protein [Thiomicrorhabdus indica]|uniref:hypothetical protein n=1 Tax=Thiomicrorhabdus indica TaxID=2267253 RepID=UPI002AA762EC|nr:hypothetical protein [Thiomicrorhabdus indica]